MELENMKRIFFAALIALGIMLTGCSGEEPAASEKAVVKETAVSSEDNEPAATEEIGGNKSEEPQEVSNKSAESGSNEKSSENPSESQDQSTIEAPASPEQSGTENQSESKEQPTIEAPAPPEQSGTEIQPESKVDSFFNENQTFIMAGIIVVLILLILILAWLIYDRRKMKIKLNNQSNVSPPPIMPTMSSNEKLDVRVGNLQNIGSRQEQQDSFCVSNIGDKSAIRAKGLMAVVADGMGGLEGGSQISNLVTETFLNSYNGQPNFDPATFLYRTAESAELAVEQLMKSNGINGGSTVVAVVIKDSLLNYVSVGDSHIYLLRDNVLELINREHSFGALLKEKAARGEVDANEPYVNPKRNALTAYIGIGNFNVVDRNAQPIPLQVGDKILLCSDGVYNALGDEAIVAALTGDALTSARRLQQDILSQAIPTQDNFTAVILECVQR